MPRQGPLHGHEVLSVGRGRRGGHQDAVLAERHLHAPLGGGIGRKFTLADRQWRTSVQFYGNVAKPDGAPDWSLRFALTAVIPF